MLNFIKPVFAAATGTGVSLTDLENSVNADLKLTPYTKLGSLFSQPLLRFVFVAVGLFFMLSLAMAGWDYILSSGDPKKVATASTRITNGFMGLVMSMTAYVVVKVILAFLGLKDAI